MKPKQIVAIVAIAFALGAAVTYSLTVNGKVYTDSVRPAMEQPGAAAHAAPSSTIPLQQPASTPATMATTMQPIAAPIIRHEPIAPISSPVTSPTDHPGESPLPKAYDATSDTPADDTDRVLKVTRLQFTYDVLPSTEIEPMLDHFGAPCNVDDTPQRKGVYYHCSDGDVFVRFYDQPDYVRQDDGSYKAEQHLRVLSVTRWPPQKGRWPPEPQNDDN